MLIPGSLGKMTVIFYLPFFLEIILNFVGVWSFNVNVQHARVFSGQKNTYFGFSVALHRNIEGHWVLSGAPKANSSILLHQYNIVESGILFICNFRTKGCKEIVVDRTGNMLYPGNDEMSYKDLKDHGWLGVSIDTRPTNETQIVVCAHLWKNQRYKHYYLPNGLCYTIDGGLDTPVTKLTPLVPHSKQIIKPGIYFYAVGQAGISSHYTEDSDLILGAPGIYDWLGSVVYYKEGALFDSLTKTDSSYSQYEKPIVPWPLNELSHEAYFGYSVSSGKFFSDRNIQLVIGAPRDDYRGRVYIMSIPNSKEQVTVKFKKEGQQMGEYFGAAVCAVDLNSDGLSDLLVGAPQYATEVDEGRVYVYHNEGSGFLNPLKDIIMGSGIINSRFGSAIGSIGDLNQDGFSDIAVGAPYENGKGAIYIYHGSRNGLIPKYIQRIGAEQIGSTALTGFGISFSRGLDMDDNHYPDFGVGAYESAHVVVFRTHPVVSLKGSLDFDQLQIRMNNTHCRFHDQPVPCFHLESCFYYTGSHVSSMLDIVFEVEMDIFKLNESRVYFNANDTIKQKISFITRLKKKENKCESFEIHLQKTIKDFLTPVSFRMTFGLKSNPKATYEFCAECPILNPHLPTTVTEQIAFLKNCGEDNTCQADLNITARIMGYSSERPLVIGAERLIAVSVEVTNNGEPAFQTVLRIVAPTWIEFQRIPVVCERFLASDRVLLCAIGNPLRPKEMNQLNFTINMENVPNNVTELLLNASVSTTSSEDENHLHDNSISLIQPLQKEADIFIRGVSSDEQKIFGGRLENQTSKVVQFSHKYEIMKYGPSPINAILVVITIPTEPYNRKMTFVRIRTVQTQDSFGGSAGFGNCEGYNIESKLENTVESSKITCSNTANSTDGVYRCKREIAKDKQSNPLQLNQKTAKILEIKCSAGKFVFEESISINITMEINTEDIPKYLSEYNLDRIEIITTGRVVVKNPDYDIQPASQLPDFSTASTTVIYDTPPKPKPLDDWIIPASVAAGCFLLIILIYSLLRLGFFKRQQREEMKQLLHAAELRQQEQPIHNGNSIFDSEEFLNKFATLKT